MTNEGVAAAGWVIMVAVFDEGGNFGHVTYAVAILNAADAITAAMNDCSGEAATATSQLSEEELRDLGLDTGEVLVLFDNKTDPITSGARLN
ncbi:hypothetical protein ACVIHH_008195 [Bradyrhizobium sp. USDA 4518]